MRRAAVVGLVSLLAAALPALPRDDKKPEKTITNSVGMKLALIPAGKFHMGSPAAEDEQDSAEEGER